jgi:4a-hydroxytetrahydrobiopterin dehydratase
MNLKDKKCIPCMTYVPPLGDIDKKKFLDELEGAWELTHNSSRITSTFKFKNFKKALDFVNEIGRVAEEERHHPDITFGWGFCRVEIWTHTNNNLVENDFILAAKINDVFKVLYPET